MSDRSYVTLTLPLKAIEMPEILLSIEEQLGPWSELKASSEVEWDEYFVHIDAQEMNYGEMNVFSLLEDLGIPFTHEHSPGDNYSASEYAFDGEESFIVELNSASSPCVSLSEIAESIENAKKANDFSVLDNFLTLNTLPHIDFEAISNNENLWKGVNVNRVAKKLK